MRKSNTHLLLLLLFLMLLVIYVVYVLVQNGQSVESWKNSLEEEIRLMNDTWSHSTTFLPEGTSVQSIIVAADKDIFLLPNVQDHEEVFISGKNIFFVLSTLSPDGKVKLTARQACAIESAARTNPDWKVFPLFTSASWFNVTNNEFITPLLQYCNIRPMHINLNTFAVGSPLESLFGRGALNQSSFIVEHTADVLRLLTLFKYGGTYLDTDVIVRKSLDSLQPNYLGSEGSGYVANGVINLQATGYGHEFAESCLNDLAQNFDGKVWAANGPFMVTRNLQKFCKVTNVTEMTREQCGGQLTVHPPDVFYRIRYPRHDWFFYPSHSVEVMDAIKDDVLVHMWNKATSFIHLKVNSTAAYVQLAEEFCPHVLTSCDEDF